MSVLGDMLRQRRDRLGLSMRETARRIGISPSYLVALEQGRNPSTGRPPVPSPKLLVALGRVLEIDLTALLDTVGAAPSPSVHLLLYQTGSTRSSPVEAAADTVPAGCEGLVFLPYLRGERAPVLPARTPTFSSRGDSPLIRPPIL